jgi:hypothetical protein
MQISIDIELEHRPRRIAGSAGRRSLRTLEAAPRRIEFVHKGINHPDRVVRIH